MTTATTSTLEQFPFLKERFAILQRRLLLLGIASATGWGAIAALAVIIAAAWLDLAIDLPGAIRASVGFIAIPLAIAVAVRILLRSRRSASIPELAHSLDRAARANGQIVSGIELAISPPADASVLTEGLARLATRRSLNLLRLTALDAAIPQGALSRPVMLLGAIGVFILSVGLISPRLLNCQWLRLTDPFGDHPPYSAIVFTVDPGTTKVIFGNAVDVRATTSGAIVSQADLIFAAPGQADQQVPMFPEGDGHWRATIANVTSPGQYFLRAGSARTQRYDIGVITVPQIQKVTFHVALPAYTHRPPYEGPMPQAGLAGLPGTKVVVHATSNRLLSGGKLLLTFSAPAATQPAEAQAGPNTQEIAMAPTTAGSNEVAGEFEIRRAGQFDLKLVDTDGQSSVDSFSGSVTLLTDERPFVRITQPPAMSYATPDAAMRISADAEDDYGISKLQIYRGLNDSSFRAAEISVPTPAPTQLVGNLPLQLSDYGLSPGDVIKLFARVEDNDPAGAKGSESTVVMIHIVSQKEMDRMQMTLNAMEMLQSKYAQAARRLEAVRAETKKLQDELKNEDPNKPLTDEQKKKLDQLGKDLDKAAAEMDRLDAHDLPIDLDMALKEQLAKASAAMKDAAQTARASTQPSLGVAGALDKLDKINKQLGAKQDDLQKEANEPLEYLAQIFPLIQDQARFIDLYQHQKDLADRLDSLRSKNGEDDPQLKVRMRDLRDEQVGLHAQMRKLLDDIDNHVAALPSDKRLDDLRKTASDFSTAVRASAADTQMQDAETGLDEFSGTRGADNARSAADTLSAFIGRCNSIKNGSQTCLKFQPKLSSGLGNSIDELLGLEGLGTGMGGGIGGYSASHNSLQNVGLYGTIPVTSARSGGGGGHADRGMASRDNGSPNGQENPDSAQQHGEQHANGAGDAPVPPQYKKRVGDYFQRVEDELSE